jgi:hypothetical protein
MEQNGGLFMDLQDTPFFKQRVGMRAGPLSTDMQYSSAPSDPDQCSIAAACCMHNHFNLGRSLQLPCSMPNTQQ